MPSRRLPRPEILPGLRERVGSEERNRAPGNRVDCGCAFGPGDPGQGGPA